MSLVPETIAAKTLPVANGMQAVATESVQNPVPSEVVTDVQLEAVSWQKELAEAIRSSTELLSELGFNSPARGGRDAETDRIQAALETDFPVFVPRSFFRRIRPGDPHDPLLQQVLPDVRELQRVPGFVTDAVGDQAARRAPGLLQKYAGRALLIATGTCAIHCRYCFRREYPYGEEPRNLEDWESAFRELESDQSLSEVILSGGDPLMLTDVRLNDLCQRIGRISHVQRIRFHTRLPIVLPTRMTSQLIEILRGQRPQIIIVVHTNHPQEIDVTCDSALKKLVRSGIPVLNQAVLLKGINDHADILEELCRRLINRGVIPYYLHQLDRVNGTAHFEVPVEIGKSLIRELAKRLPGYAVPRYVQEIPGQPHKSLI